MFVHNAHAVFVLGDARRSAGGVPEGEQHRRRQNAEQIRQREQSPCRRSSGPGKPAQHRSFGSLPPDGRAFANLDAKRAHAKCLRSFRKCSVLPGQFRKGAFPEGRLGVKAGDANANRSALLRAERRQEDAITWTAVVPSALGPGGPRCCSSCRYSAIPAPRRTPASRHWCCWIRRPSPTPHRSNSPLPCQCYRRRRMPLRQRRRQRHPNRRRLETWPSMAKQRKPRRQKWSELSWTSELPSQLTEAIPCRETSRHSSLNALAN